MNKGLCLFGVAALLTGCSGSSKNSSEIKLINNNGYAAYRTDENPWIEIHDELYIPENTNFDTLSLVDVCTNDGEYIEFNISIFSSDSFLHKSNTKSEIDLGCHDFSREESELSSFTLGSENASISLEDVFFPKIKDYSETGTENNKLITIGTTKHIKGGQLLVIGKSEKLEYYFHFQNDFSFADNSTYTIDFYDDHSTRAIAEDQLGSEDYSYSRALRLEEHLVPLSIIVGSDLHLRPVLEDYFPSTSFYTEQWRTKSKYNGFKLNVSSNNTPLKNHNPLPDLIGKLSEIAITYNDDKSISIRQSPSINSFIDFPTENIISYYRFNSADFRYENNTPIDYNFSVPSPTEFYNLPNFPDEAKLDMSSIMQNYIFITKGNGIDHRKEGSETYTIEKETNF